MSGLTPTELSAPSAISLNTWTHITCTYDGVSRKMFLNGVLVANDSPTGIMDVNNTPLAIGNSSVYSGPGYGFNGSIDDVKIYNYARTPDQILEDMQGRAAVISSTAVGIRTPADYWKFDEGQGITAHSSGTQNTNGTLTNMASPATGVSGWQQTGKYGKALAFNGTNNYVDFGDMTYLENTGTMSASLWVKPNALGTQRCLLCKYQNSAAAGKRSFGIETGSSDSSAILLEWSNDGNTTQATATSPTGALTAGQWTHIVVTYDASRYLDGNSNVLKLYINGVQKALTFTGTVPASIYATTANMRAGASSDSTAARLFNGMIDELKIYTGALNSDGVKTEYNHGAAMVLGANTTEGNYLAYDSFTRSDGAIGQTESTDPNGKPLTPLAWSSSGSTWTVSSNGAINTPTLGTDIFPNGNMESGNPPTGWTALNGCTLTAEADRTGSGTQSLGVVRGTSNYCAKLTATQTVGIWYQFWGWAKSDLAGQSLLLETGSGVQPQYGFYSQCWPTITSWYRFKDVVGVDSVPAIARATGTTRTFQIDSNDSSKKYFDDLTLQPLVTSELMTSVSASNTDVDASANVTLSNRSSEVGLVLNLDSVSNPQNYVLVYLSSNADNTINVNLEKVINGIYTTVWNAYPLPLNGNNNTINHSLYQAGSPLEVIKSGTNYTVYYNNKYIGTATISDSQIINNTRYGLFNTYSGNNLDNFSLMTVGNGGENSLPGNYSGNPIAQWKFEEGSGTTVNDSTGNNNTGTITPGNGYWTQGKIGKGFMFDGSTSTINAGSGTIIDNLPSGGMTIEAWIYPRSMGKNNAGVIMAKNVGPTPSSGWLFQMAGTNALTFRVNAYDGSPNTDMIRTTINDVLTLNAWNHVVVTWANPHGMYDVTVSNVHIYVNGFETSYATSTDGNRVRAPDDSSNFYIGNDSTSASTFDGKIDQVTIFNYARTPAQIAWDYNRGGPVGYWKFNECTGTTLHDSASATNSATITPGSAGVGTCTDGTGTTFWNKGATGKYGASGYFDGSATLATVAAPINNVYAVSFWAKATTAAQSYLQLNPGVYITSDANGTVSATGFSSPSVYVNGKLNGTVTAGSWNHILVTSATSLSASAIKFGIQNSIYYTGQIDEVKIWNYALTSVQVKLDYNQASAIRFGPLTGAP